MFQFYCKPQAFAPVVVTPQAATPTFSPVAGSYAGTQTVTISCTTPSPTLYYTTDGTTPTFPITGTTQLYTTPISVSVSETVRAIATASGFSTSAVGSAAYTIGGALAGAGSNQVFSFPSGFTAPVGSGALRLGFDCALQGSDIQLPFTTSQHHAGCVVYTTQVNITSFSTQFNFSMSTAGWAYSNGNYSSLNGICFVVQNSNTTTNPPPQPSGTLMASDANTAGYGAYSNQNPGQTVGNSLAIKFDCNTYGAQAYSPHGFPSTVGLLINGGPNGQLYTAYDTNPFGINFYNNHSYTATVTYDGTYLTLVLLDTTSNAQGRWSWPIDIPSIMGQSTSSRINMGWVGLQGGQVFNGAQLAAGAAQLLHSWSFSDGSVSTLTRLAAPTFSPAGGAYASTQTVTLSGAGSIYYTTNGNQATSASTLYTGPITVSANTIINAVAIQSGFTDSYQGQANYLINNGGLTVNFPSGFAGSSNLITLTGSAHLSGANLILCDAGTAGSGPASDGTFEVAGAWYAAPIPISTFTTSFQLKYNSFTNVGHNGVGTVFVIHNQPPVGSTYSFLTQASPGCVTGGTNMVGNFGTGLGYGSVQPGSNINGVGGGILNSIGLKFDVMNNSTGLYTNGAEPTTPQTTITGVTLTSGNPLNVALSYNGTTLSMLMTDTVTHATFSTSFVVNIPSIIGGSTGIVGFTAAATFSFINQIVQNWTM